MNNEYTIELWARRLGGQAGHLFWVKRNPAGEVVAEMHFNRGENDKLEFLLPKTRENFWTKKYASSIMQLEFDGKPFIVYRGSKDDVDFRWDIGTQVGEYLHDKISYPRDETTFLGIFGQKDLPNSNAGAFTLGTIMLPEGVGEGEHDWNLITPGWGYYLFRSPELDFKNAPKIKDRFILGRAGETSLAKASLSDNDAALGERQKRSGDPTQMTPAGARRAIAAAKADDAFGKRYVKGDPETVSYMHALHRAAYPEPGSDSPGLGEADRAEPRAARPGVQRASAAAGSQGDSQNGLAPWMSEATAAARKALTDLTADSNFVNRYLDGGRKEFDRFQGLMRAAYPEPDAADAVGAETGGAASALKPWSPSVSSDANNASNGVAPWLRDAFTSEATRAPGAEPGAESTIAPWMGDWKPDWRRRSGD